MDLTRSRIWFADDPPIMTHRTNALLGKINPNTATAASLQRLPGIGPVLAEAIVGYRNERYPAVIVNADDLAGVDGIGPATINRIRTLLVFDRNKANNTPLTQVSQE